MGEGREWVSVSVRDNGPGIDPNILPRLFEPFVSTRMDAPGTGLGEGFLVWHATGYGSYPSEGGHCAFGPTTPLPLEMLKVLHATKEGGMLLNSSPQGHTVVKVVGIRKMPVDEATARPKIQAFLINQRVAEVTTNELKSLKTTAKIEYVGSLADLPKPDTSPRQGPGAASTNLPALPQLEQMPINTGDNNAKK